MRPTANPNAKAVAVRRKIRISTSISAQLVNAMRGNESNLNGFCNQSYACLTDNSRRDGAGTANGEFRVHNQDRIRQHAALRGAGVIDFDHLDQYTLGDADLQGELLRLFSIQLENQLAELSACTGAGAWKQASHTLKGAARAVGVWQVADVAERLETAGFDGGAGDARDLEDLRKARDAFVAELARLAG